MTWRMPFEVVSSTPSRFPSECTEILGFTHSERATTMIRDLISSTEVIDDQLCLQMSDDVNEAMLAF